MSVARLVVADQDARTLFPLPENRGLIQGCEARVGLRLGIGTGIPGAPRAGRSRPGGRGWWFISEAEELEGVGAILELLGFRLAHDP